MRLKFTLSLFFALFILGVFIAPARADGIIIPFPPICDPAPCPPEPIPLSQLEIRYHHVEVSINNQIAVTHVDQVFYNPNDWTVEGDYIFPIPRGAAVTAFILWIDGEPVEGEILDADQARQTYEDIVRQMQDPALLEYADQGAMRARIFPIAPEGERRIELEYTEVLVAENELVRYLYPLNTEKFSTKPLDSVRVSVDVQASSPIRAVYSPSHPIAVSRETDTHVVAGYEDSNVKPDTDFALYYSLGDQQAFHLLSYRDPSDAVDSDGFFMLLLAPSPESDQEAIPKDVILVLDRSGSMEGEKFHQAQEALRFILTHLNPEDRFNAIAFSTGLETYATGLRSTSEINEALAWVDRLSAVGSTDINRALLDAIAIVDAERPTYVIFLTDGLPTEGVIESQDILDNLSAAAPPNLRLFAFGVGYDVDTFLLDSLTDEHHGTSTYVLPGERLDEILSVFYDKISTPVLIDLELDFGELRAFDIYPAPLPDLFSGSQIVVVGRYREGGSTDVSLQGEVNGEIVTFRYPDQVFAPDNRGEIGPLAALPRLWATRKIGYLLNQIRLHGPDQEQIDQIVRLSIRYGIVTPYTSYLVTEPLPLGEAEQERIAEEQFADMEAAPQAPAYGREAVEKAADQGALEGSNNVGLAPVEAADVVRIVGSRAYVFGDGVWVDTAFDPGQMETVKVAFLSDDYFTLTESSHELAAAFALGSRVITILDRVAYEIVPADTPTQPISLPPDPDPTVASPPSPTSTPVPDAANEPPNQPTVDPTKSAPSSCLGGLAPAILLPILVLVISKSGARKTGI